jgi:hypothetical protein
MKLLRSLAVLAVVIGAASTMAFALPHTASAVDFFGGICDEEGRGTAACSGTGEDNLSGTDGIILRVANLVAIVSGIAAVIVIMVAAIMFITAAGDSNKISTAKRTIVYAVVGLAIIALSRVIVIFVIGNV